MKNFDEIYRIKTIYEAAASNILTEIYLNFKPVRDIERISKTAERIIKSKSDGFCAALYDPAGAAEDELMKRAAEFCGERTFFIYDSEVSADKLLAVYFPPKNALIVSDRHRKLKGVFTINVGDCYTREKLEIHRHPLNEYVKRAEYFIELSRNVSAGR